MKGKHLPSKVKPAKAKKAGSVSLAASEVAKARMIQKKMDENPGEVPGNPHY